MMSKPFRLDKAALMLDQGASMALCAMNLPRGTQVQWRVDRPDIAEVNGDGVVTAKADGDAVVTAKADGAGEASCIISVGYPGQNPYLPPTWGLYIADGEPHVFDGRMYIFGSRDCPEGYLKDSPKEYDWCSDSYHVIWSDDLIHWVDAGEALSIGDIPADIRLMDMPADIRGAGTRLWAPDAFRCPRTGKYYLTFCSNGADVYIAQSDSPTGPYTDVRLLRMGGEVTKYIDPGVLADGDKVYIVLPGGMKEFPKREFFIAQLDPDDYANILPETKVDLFPLIDAGDPDYFPFEGPSIRKRGDTFYYLYIASRKGEFVPTRIEYLTSKNPLDFNSWTYAGPIIETRDFIRAGNVHGSMEAFEGDWILSYHRMAQGFKRFTRCMNMDRLTFGRGGEIIPVIRTSSGVKGAFATGELIYAASACWFAGGRDDDRFLIPGRKPPLALNGFACVSLKENAVGFRYVAADSVSEIEIWYRNKCDSRIRLEVGSWAAELTLPDSYYEWRSARLGIAPPDGKAEVRFSLLNGNDCSLYALRMIRK